MPLQESDTKENTMDAEVVRASRLEGAVEALEALRDPFGCFGGCTGGHPPRYLSATSGAIVHTAHCAAARKALGGGRHGIASSAPRNDA